MAGTKHSPVCVDSGEFMASRSDSICSGGLALLRIPGLKPIKSCGLEKREKSQTIRHNRTTIHLTPQPRHPDSAVLAT